MKNRSAEGGMYTAARVLGQFGQVGRNSAWMMLEQFLRQGIAFCFSIWVARQYGPAGIGSLSFGLSLCLLFSAVAALGLNRIVVRELAAPDGSYSARELLGTVLTLRLAAAGAAAAATVVVGALTSSSSLLVVAILSFSLLFTPFDVVDLYYQSSLRSGVVAKSRLAAVSVSSMAKACLLAFNVDLAWIAVAYVLDYALTAVALLLLARRDALGLRLSMPRRAIAGNLLAESWSEVIAGVSVLVFMRIDQVMLQSMNGPVDTGIMAVATRLSEIWYFVPAAIVSSVYPGIVALQHSDPVEAERRQVRLYRHLILLSLVTAVVMTVASRWIVELLYGHEFGPAAEVLRVQAWCGVFMCLGVASGAWLMSRKLGRYNLYRTVFGALLNVALNLVLIPRYGPVGAAWASLAAFSVAYFLIDFAFGPTREIGRNKLRAMGIG